MISIALRIEEEFNVKLPSSQCRRADFDDENTCVTVFTQRVVKLLEEQQAQNQPEGEQVS